MDIRQALEDGWKGREAQDFVLWVDRIDAVIGPVLGLTTEFLSYDYDYAAAFRHGVTASDVAEHLIADAWRV